MPHKLGISEDRWTQIQFASGGLLLITTLRTVMNTIGSTGVFGYGKNKNLANFGKTKEQTWNSLQAVSLALVAVTMLEQNHAGLVDMANNSRFKRIKENVF